MYSILICEDCLVQLKIIKTMVEKFIMFNDDFQLEVATNSPEIIQDKLMEQTISKGIFILDIDLNHAISGIDLAEEIRKINAQAKIIFITTHEEAAPLTINRRVEALDFIIKDQPDEVINIRLIESLVLAKSRFVDIQELNNQNFSFSVGSHLYNIDLAELLFIAPSGKSHKLIIYTTTGQYEFYGSLSSIESKYPQLYRASKKGLINPKNIKRIDSSQRKLWFDQDLFCPYAIGRTKEIKGFLTK